MAVDPRTSVARLRSGDRIALGEFVQEHGDQMREIARQRILRLAISREAEPDEILNAAILELCSRTDRISSIQPEKFLWYFKRVVRTQVDSVWRTTWANKRGKRRTWRSFPFDIPDRSYPSIQDVELNESIDRAYDEMSGHERLISMLRRAGWPWEEIADRLRARPESVRRRWNRAIVRVLRRLE